MLGCSRFWGAVVLRPQQKRPCIFDESGRSSANEKYKTMNKEQRLLALERWEATWSDVSIHRETLWALEKDLVALIEGVTPQILLDMRAYGEDLRAEANRASAEIYGIEAEMKVLNMDNDAWGRKGPDFKPRVVTSA